ncbi:MAG: hypothetical protein AB7O66_01280 [Limisphaerales bacterium]
MSSEPLASLSDLPEVASRCVRDCDRARRILLRESLPRIAVSTAAAPITWLGPVQLTWRYYLAWDHQRPILSFNRRRNRIEVALDSTLRFQVVPSPPLAAEDFGAASVEESLPPRSRLLWPRFLDSASPALAVFHLEIDSRLRRLELPIANDAVDFRSARWMSGATELPPRQGGRFLLEPFVDWIRTVAAWMRDPEPVSTWRPLPPPSAKESLPARQILSWIVRTFLEAKGAAQSGATSEDTEDTHAESPTPGAPDADVTRSRDWVPVDDLVRRQDVLGFSGRTWLRLKQDGTAIAESHDDEPTTLEMGYTLGHDRGRDWLDVRLHPPDFLLSGVLHQQILETVADAVIAAKWHQRGRPLGRETDLAETAVHDLFAAGRGQTEATVMRIRRKRDRDLDLILLRGPLAGKIVWVVMTAWLVVERPKNRDAPDTRTLRVSGPPVVNSQHGAEALLQGGAKKNDGLDCIFVGEDFSGDPTLPDAILPSLGRLMLALHRWGGIWPPPDPAAVPALPSEPGP